MESKVTHFLIDVGEPGLAPEMRLACRLMRPRPAGSIANVDKAKVTCHQCLQTQSFRKTPA